MIRARAPSAGVPLPPAGSFRDAVMQETLFRERNRSFVTMSVVVGAIEAVGHTLLDAVLGYVHLKDAKLHASLHEPLRTTVSKLMHEFEVEVYEDRYLPAYRQRQAVIERREKLAAIEHQQRFAETKRRVEALSEDEEPLRK